MKFHNETCVLYLFSVAKVIKKDGIFTIYHTLICGLAQIDLTLYQIIKTRQLRLP